MASLYTSNVECDFEFLFFILGNIFNNFIFILTISFVVINVDHLLNKPQNHLEEKTLCMTVKHYRISLPPGHTYQRCSKLGKLKKKKKKRRNIVILEAPYHQDGFLYWIKRGKTLRSNIYHSLLSGNVGQSVASSSIQHESTMVGEQFPLEMSAEAKLIPKLQSNCYSTLINIMMTQQFWKMLCHQNRRIGINHFKMF